jgi:hypothetical protein
MNTTATHGLYLYPHLSHEHPVYVGTKAECQGAVKGLTEEERLSGWVILPVPRIRPVPFYSSARTKGESSVFWTVAGIVVLCVLLCLILYYVVTGLQQQ